MAGIIIAQTVQYGDELPVWTWRKGGKDDSDKCFRLIQGSASDDVAGNEIIEVDEDKNIRFFGNVTLDNIQLQANSLDGSLLKDGTVPGSKIQANTTITATLIGNADSATKDASGNVITTTYATKSEVSSLTTTVGTKLNQAQADLLYAKLSDLEITNGKVDSNTSNISTLQGTVSTATQNITSLQSSVYQNTSAISTANGNITNLQNQKINISGDRGQIGGYEQTASLSGSQTFTISSADTTIVHTTGNVTFTFTPAAETQVSVKVIEAIADGTTTLNYAGMVWNNNGSAPTWGTAGARLVLVAHWIGGQVVVNVSHNTEA